jgi:hypothetical protein
VSGHPVDIPAGRPQACFGSRGAAGASFPFTRLRRAAARAAFNRKACTPNALPHSAARAGIGRLSEPTRSGASIAN